MTRSLISVSLLGLAALTILATSVYLLAVPSPLSSTQQRATYAQWVACEKDNNYTPFCNQYTDRSLNQNCENTYAQVSSCEIANSACQRYFIYMEGYVEDEELPDAFYDCTQGCSYLSHGDAFFEKNYNIQHFQCAYYNQ